MYLQDLLLLQSRTPDMIRGFYQYTDPEIYNLLYAADGVDGINGVNDVNGVNGVCRSWTNEIQQCMTQIDEHINNWSTLISGAERDLLAIFRSITSTMLDYIQECKMDDSFVL